MPKAALTPRAKASPWCPPCTGFAIFWAWQNDLGQEASFDEFRATTEAEIAALQERIASVPSETLADVAV